MWPVQVFEVAKMMVFKTEGAKFKNGMKFVRNLSQGMQDPMEGDGVGGLDDDLVDAIVAPNWSSGARFCVRGQGDDALMSKPFALDCARMARVASKPSMTGI